MPTEVGRHVSFTAYDSYEKERYSQILECMLLSAQMHLMTMYTVGQATGDVPISLSVEWTDEQLNAHRVGTNS